MGMTKLLWGLDVLISSIRENWMSRVNVIVSPRVTGCPWSMFLTVSATSLVSNCTRACTRLWFCAADSFLGRTTIFSTWP